jgi:hypothetical protein
MGRSWPGPVTVLLLLAGLCAARAAHSDDWPQFRRDSSRSAASLDRIKLPLTEVWSWTTRADRTARVVHILDSPLFHASVWRDRVFFVAAEGSTRSVVCADAKTGAVLWRQALAARSLGSGHTDSIGPVVSKQGVVFAYDVEPRYQVSGGHGTGAGGFGTDGSVRQRADAEVALHEWRERAHQVGEQMLSELVAVGRARFGPDGLPYPGGITTRELPAGVRLEKNRMIARSPSAGASTCR